MAVLLSNPALEFRLYRIPPDESSPWVRQCHIRPSPSRILTRMGRGMPCPPPCPPMEYNFCTAEGAPYETIFLDFEFCSAVGADRIVGGNPPSQYGGRLERPLALECARRGRQHEILCRHGRDCAHGSTGRHRVPGCRGPFETAGAHRRQRRNRDKSRGFPSAERSTVRGQVEGRRLEEGARQPAGTEFCVHSGRCEDRNFRG